MVSNAVELPSIQSAKCGMHSLSRHVEGGCERLVNQNQVAVVLADFSIRTVADRVDLSNSCAVRISKPPRAQSAWNAATDSRVLARARRSKRSVAEMRLKLVSGTRQSA